MKITDYEIVVDRVIDGDTFVSNLVEFEIMDIKIHFPNIHFRMLGVNTPEKKQPGFKEATTYTRNMIEGKKVRIAASGKDVFDRVLCVVYPEDQEKSLNDLLLETKLAKVYEK